MGRSLKNTIRFTAYTIIFVFSATLLGVGNTLRNDATRFISAPGPLTRNETCVLSQGVVRHIGENAHVAVWKRISDSGPDMVVVSPFAVRKTEMEALEDLMRNGTTCACLQITDPNRMYPDVSADLSNTCMLDQAVTDYVRHVGWIYGYSGDAALASGAFLLVLFFIAMMLLMVDMGFFNCSGKRNIPYREADKNGYQDTDL